MSNSDNPKIGKIFQCQVCDWFTSRYGNSFELEIELPIGDPPKGHSFDIVDVGHSIVIECKRYTWTETGNVPSAKIRTLNEAVLFLSFLPESYTKYIVMLRSYHAKKQETLAEYYYRTNGHLLGDIIVAEYDPETREMRIIGNELNG
ncbi:MAG: hypothetical protein II803_02685 [Firmicutes bacterium]|nr:hypothetical protein [Bacillota bacterium]